MRRWLAFGLSGAVGQALRARWSPLLATIDAVSREARADAPGLHWHRGSLEAPPPLAEAWDAVLSLGPLDRFAAWFCAQGVRAPVLVALGSTGVHDKAASPDPAERELAARLAAAEARLAAACAARESRLVLLRPGLLWGGEADAFTPLVAAARRWRLLPVPRSATGLRQPVHVDDVAAAVLAAVAGDFAGTYDLPGGEALAWREMVARVLASRAPGARLLVLPDVAFRLGFALARIAGQPLTAGPGRLARLRRDQVHDSGPATTRFQWRPRPFRP
ncbi:hypothetical protein [Arenimonas composti]|uniref:NAD-dependent epimerase/dehydratase domain-containing protein n=1 Tax=Arenimonas composti TR7-09 = DSM 18010 TaxID=1121013 RepID=A0A091BFA7_9GAMM|nr:hypothetical protein [Arenimonas composti]KFN51388.1 hypothetical protein P873_03725 [Arenimonas composti TR7-09 = DSM 18010]